MEGSSFLGGSAYIGMVVHTLMHTFLAQVPLSHRQTYFVRLLFAFLSALLPKKLLPAP